MTVGEAIASGKTVRGDCTECGKGKDIDLARLPLPRDLELGNAGTRLRCTDCGSRLILLTVVGAEE